MDLQDPKVQRFLIAGLFSVLLLYGFFGTSLMGFTYPSQRDEATELNAEYEKLSRELERARLTVKNMAKLEREFEYLHRQWKVAQKLLPEENEMSGLLRQITAAGSQAGLQFVHFEPKPSIAQGFYKENPIYVEIEGGYHQFGSFVSQLANLNRIINVRDLDLMGVKPEQQGDDKINHTLEASLEIVSYSVDPAAATVNPDGATSQQLAQSNDTRNISQVRDRITGRREAEVAQQGGH